MSSANGNNKKLAVLVSGSGTNLQAIIDAIKNGDLQNTEIKIVISSKKDAYALKRAETAGINNVFLDPLKFKDRYEYDQELVKVVNSCNVDLIVLAGYVKILTNIFVSTFKHKIINIHPALLPNFGGKGMYGEIVHEAVLKSGAKESGCTVHFVTEEVDAGPIIGQKRVPVIKGDTVETLSKRILEQEHKLLVESINKVLGKTIYDL